MSAAYYDFYAEEGTVFVAKLNIVDKLGNQVSFNTLGTGSNISIPVELEALGMRYVYSVAGKMQVRNSINTTSSLVLEFKSDSSVPSSLGSGLIDLKAAGQYDHNIVLSAKIPGVTATTTLRGTYLYDLQLTYTAGTCIPSPTSLCPAETIQTFDIKILQGRFIIVPEITQG
jgi:hypothetical protein